MILFLQISKEADEDDDDLDNARCQGCITTASTLFDIFRASAYMQRERLYMLYAYVGFVRNR
jgi:hypothetical protein